MDGEENKMIEHGGSSDEDEDEDDDDGGMAFGRGMGSLGFDPY
jgi:hypothetical protein